MTETAAETLARVRRLVADEEAAALRLVELARQERTRSTGNQIGRDRVHAILLEAAGSMRGQLAVDRKWLADLEAKCWCTRGAHLGLAEHADRIVDEHPDCPIHGGGHA